MEDIHNFFKYNKLNLYKDGLKKFIELQINQDNKWNKVKKNLINNLDNLDFIIGILFLTEMNRHCKNNGISIHGYYITCALMNFFINIKNKILFGKKISNESIIFLFNNIANNIEYLNSRVDSSNQIRKKINENYSSLMIEITPLINEIVYFKKEHVKNQNMDLGDEQIVWELHNSVENENNENNENGCCNKNCYSCWVDEILTKFIYILLIVAKFMGTGNTKDPNLYKLAEYYSNVIYVILRLDSISNLNKYTDNYYQNLFVNYQDYKSKLIYSIMELEINSDTIDEIIRYLDSEIINKFLVKKITIN
jgi:hypothetical protein